jgi:hypothetical protein
MQTSMYLYSSLSNKYPPKQFLVFASDEAKALSVPVQSLIHHMLRTTAAALFTSTPSVPNVGCISCALSSMSN